MLAAAQAGAAAVHCTVNCLGERAGNASLAEVVVNLRDHLEIPDRALTGAVFPGSEVIAPMPGLIRV